MKDFYDHTDKASQDPENMEHRQKVRDNVKKAIELLKEAEFEENVNKKCNVLKNTTFKVYISLTPI